jgi:uncharacterized DUF497 family protein
MDFEWDEAKRRRVLGERGLDFVDGAALFDGRNRLTVPSPRGSEERWVSIGELDGLLVAVVWMWRSGNIRLVTMRRARDEEKRQYHQAFG